LPFDLTSDLIPANKHGDGLFVRLGFEFFL
jgi:hypothetical protein